MKRIIALALITTLPGLAHAHGDAGDGFMMNIQHVVSSPEHLWPLLVLAVMALTLNPLARRLMRRIMIKTRS